MNKLVWKLLRQHISGRQLVGFFLANLAGMLIVTLSIQFYKDILPMFTQGDSFLKNEYVIATKRISTLGTLTGRNNTFTEKEIKDLKEQAFTRNVGAFTPSLFHVSAGVGMQDKGLRMSTDMFFESVPDEYVDVSLNKWHFNEENGVIPIIIPRNYLNLYNFGFAQSRNLPKLSEGLMSVINMDVKLSGNGKVQIFKGNIVGFSNRLNTILVPQAFLTWANSTFAPGKEAKPSRLIIEVKNPADPSIADYFTSHGYETEGNALDSGKTTHFLRIITGIVLGVGLFISLLSFYILMLSIYLLLQKNAVKLQNLLLIGYSPRQISIPYCTLAVTLNAAICFVSILGVWWIRGIYCDLLQGLYPQLEIHFMWPTLLTSIILFLTVSACNVTAIRKKVKGTLSHAQ